MMLVISQPPDDVEDVAAFVVADKPSPEDLSDDDTSDPDRMEVLQELWSSGCMSDLFTALKGVQVALQLASTHPTLAGAIANLGAVTQIASVDLEGVCLVCRRLPGLLNRRWGAGAASALADEADHLNLERRRLLCVDGFSILPTSLQVAK
jgi:hypothetical protein